MICHKSKSKNIKGNAKSVFVISAARPRLIVRHWTAGAAAAEHGKGKNGFVSESGTDEEEAD